jgi:hypothetical protein
MTDGPFTLAATATSALPVTFSVLSGPATSGGANGSTITLTGATGAVTIRASQAGNGNYLPAATIDRTFTVIAAAVAPTVATAPASRTATVGNDVTFSVLATGTAPLTYVWKHGGSVVGANSETLTLASISSANAGTYTVTVSNAAGSATASAVLSVTPVTQSITFPALADRAANAGSIALTASATSGLEIEYTVVAGPATVSGTTLILTSEAGYVTVRASQSGNADYFPAADVERSFTVSPAPAAPAFVLQPSSLSLTGGAVVTLTGAATGFPAPTYQWRKNGRDIAGATESTLTVVRATPADSGTYQLIATNPHGSAASNEAIVVISKLGQSITFETPTSPKPVGTAITLTATASSGLPVGYSIVSGAGLISGGRLVSQSTSVVVRATQPGNASVDAAIPVNRTFSFTVNGSAPFFTSAPEDTFVDVGSVLTLSASALGTPTPSFRWEKNGTPLQNATGGVLTLRSVTVVDAGTYTVTATNAVGSTSASAVITVRAGPENSGSSSDRVMSVGHLTNLAIRGTIKSGESLVAGFVVSGTAAQRILIRALGPTLAASPFNLTGTAPNPQLTVCRGDTVLRTNDDWFRDSAADHLSVAAAEVGACELAPTSLDAAVMLNLEPGAYTVQVAPSSSDSTVGGLCLIEIYEVPK